MCTNESFSDVNVGTGVRLMVRGVCLPLRGSERRTWKYDDDDKCSRGLVEAERHVLFECTLYGEKKRNMERGCKGFERWYGGI